MTTDKFKFYDQGWNARVKGEPFEVTASKDWRDGWLDCDSAEESQRSEI